MKAKRGNSVSTGTPSSLQELSGSCHQATFGHQGVDVLDTTYRKALAMEAARFSSSFHPSDHGILQTITDLMLPLCSNSRRVHAELYKLNTYEPGGKFKPHIDTPRSETQFGSLVICLPYKHDGGALAIRHGGRESLYRWGVSPYLIGWAAFYSDCEHEVLEVTSGYRITLTYNLHFLPARTANPSSHLAVESLPLYADFRRLLNNPTILPDGGLIGLYCQHVYPRQRNRTSKDVSACLKGVDQALFFVLERLDLEVTLHFVIDRMDLVDDDDEWDEDMLSDEDIEERESEGTLVLSNQPRWPASFDELLDRVRTRSNFQLEYVDTADPGTSLTTYRQRLDWILTTRRIAGLPSEPRRSKKVDYLSNNFGEVETPLQECEKKVQALENWTQVSDIQWLNSPGQGTRDLAVAYIAYGNQAEMDHHYASLAMVARVPRYGSSLRRGSGRASGPGHGQAEASGPSRGTI